MYIALYYGKIDSVASANGLQWILGHCENKTPREKGLRIYIPPPNKLERSADSRFNTLAILPVTASKFLFPMAQEPLVGGALLIVKAS